MSSVLKGGRLAATRKEIVDFISSIQDDSKIAASTILVNQAHVLALSKARAIELDDARKLIAALQKLENSHVPKALKGLEDIHVYIEESVTKMTGKETGGWMHLAKSRNDQVATAIRMTLREELLELSLLLTSLNMELLQLAEQHTRSVFPGYTHLQPAQPITFAHYLVANADSISRDNQRLIEAHRRVNLSPMGSGALAGTSFKLDRNFVAHILQFNGLVENSLDGVGSRDFILESLAVCSMIALDLSRMAQDMIFYSCSDVHLIELPDEFTSTSSIMPQKKNPDPLEVLRARCAQVLGNFFAAATTLHALPSGYNLDFQEITPLLWRSLDTLKSSLKMLIQLIPKIELDDQIEARESLQFTAATEIANILVRTENIPFRTAHHAVGRAVKMAIKNRKTLKTITQNEWSKILGKTLRKQSLTSILDTLDLQKHLESYRTAGSPSPGQLAKMIKQRKQQTNSLRKLTLQANARLKKTLPNLHAASRNL